MPAITYLQPYFDPGLILALVLVAPEDFEQKSRVSLWGRIKYSFKSLLN
jgi:hypothetical protein